MSGGSASGTGKWRNGRHLQKTPRGGRSRGNIDRRAVLRAAALAAASFGGSRVLAACSGSASRGNAATTTCPSGPPTTVLDPSKPWWLRGNFAPVQREVEAFDLRVEGRCRKELSGLYVRNGSNPKPGWAPHWFLGDGMVHGVMLDARQGDLVSEPLRAARRCSRPAAGSRRRAPRAARPGLSNVSVVHHAGKLLTLGEVGLPYELRAERPLDRRRVRLRRTPPGQHDRASEDRSRDRDDALLRLQLHRAVPRVPRRRPQRRLVSSQPVSVKASTMIHDFAITDRDVVFWEMPVLFDMELAIKMVSETALDDHAVRLEAGVRLAASA